ncbi:unnamed protein product [Microthlaspi erraticum]|uniref:Retrotransposon gag domain-containing protein n=1 Tax=Microthlaspi erraticum TaxID=1685480 RepID=A0A6D2JRZ2_9BRAS|nr:unnamed protein product [Microthlaspi erraticum]
MVGTSLSLQGTIFSPQRSPRIYRREDHFAATIPSAKKDESPPPSAPRRSRKSSSSDKPRSSKKSSSSEKILKLMENLVKPLADGFESMRAQQKKTQEQVEALAREDDEDPSSPTDGTTAPHFRRLTTQELERMNRRLDEVDSKVHRATSSAPELTKALADTRRSPLTRRLRQIEHEKSSTQNRLLHRRRRPQEVANRVQPRHEEGEIQILRRKEANYCQVFVEHMAKDALTWFSNLPAESIDNFDDLTNAFLKHYSMHMTRITRNIRDTGDMPDSVPLEALRNGLWYDSKFKEDLSLKPPATLEDAFHRSRNYIFLEEDKRFYAEKHGDKKAALSKPAEKAAEVRKRYNPKRSLLTAFGAADDEPEQEPHHTETLPIDVATSDRDGSNMFCRLHGDGDHSTRNCRRLTRDLLRRYKHGELPPVRGDRSRRKRKLTQPATPEDTPDDMTDYSDDHQDSSKNPDRHRKYGESDLQRNPKPHGNQQRPNQAFTVPLTGFTAEHIFSEGTIRLPIHVGGTTKTAKFFVINRPAIYNAILGTPWLHEMKAIVSTFHQCVKFPTQLGVYTLRRNQRAARSCFLHERRLRLRAACTANEEMDPRLPYHQRPKPALVDEVNIDEAHPERRVGIGGDLDEKIREQLIILLKRNAHLFAWSMADMKEIDPAITSHELNVKSTYKPMKQKTRKLGTDKAQAVSEEVDKLMDKPSPQTRLLSTD